MPDSIAKNGNGRYMLLAILGLSALAMIGIVVVIIVAPGEQQASLIASVLSVTAPVVMMLGVMLKLQQTASLAERTASLAERAAAHAKANAEQTRAVQTEVKSLQVAVDGRLTQLIASMQESAALRQEVGRGQGIVEGREVGLAEADALAAARAETPPAAQAQAEAVADAVVARLQEPAPNL